MKWAQKQTGFTIVELLIVVVVIAILAAITIVAYNGIQNQAKESSVKSDIANGVKKLEVMKLQSASQQYPSSLTAAGLSASGDNSLNYEYASSDNTFCLQGANGTMRWYATSAQSTPTAGRCGSDSLVGHWTFNGNANDSTSNGLNGTVTNATLATGQNGQANSAYSFPGSAAYITMGNSTLFNHSELTMSIWARTNAVSSSNQTLIAKEGKQKYRLNAGGATLGVLSAAGSGWSHMPTCAFAYAANTWYHIVTTISSASQRIKMYVNGAQICDVAGPAITSYTTTDLMIGSHSTVGTEVFNGTLDDARFYSRALGTAEVKGLYDAGAQ